MARVEVRFQALRLDLSVATGSGRLVARRTVRTIDAISEQSKLPFVWGVSDCTQFAVKVSGAATGRDLSGGFVYSTEEEASDLISSYGALENLVTSVVKVEPTYDLHDLEDGDPLVLEIKGKKMLGVKFRRLVVYKTVRGVACCKLSDADLGWRVESCLP